MTGPEADPETFRPFVARRRRNRKENRDLFPDSPFEESIRKESGCLFPGNVRMGKKTVIYFRKDIQVTDWVRT